MPNYTIVGTIVEAGTDDSGTCRVIIHTHPRELENLADLPLYATALITIKRITNQD